ncbi:Phenylalanyl-tRNA synthetase beta chain [hydrothermal vent metagenome]|uniref:Phenylalanine--tRNA ligase beta subunit n=1 Tax=hydrothermal vent metagenome TaxID=652676 RepID=A0A3B0W0P2_9ZZZZ
MRVPLSWLKEYVNIEQSPEEVDRILTNAGLEVKTIEYIGILGADLVWDRDLLVLSQILKVEQHPNADKLVLATVDYGAEEPEIVVTGAPNLFEFVGQGDISDRQLYSPLALEGVTLYDGHKVEKKKMKLKGRPLRGIHNRCMVCSEKELGISEEHEGIILMQKDDYSPDYQAGSPLQDVLGDAVLEIDIIPNIARCASIVGVAREYAALTNQPIRYPDYSVVMEGESANGRIAITTEAPELNPRFVGYIIEEVQQNASPYWMQHRLRLAGQRPINVVVDISNYVMLEMGQPNHTFDYNFLRQRADHYNPDGPIQMITRLPHDGETLTTLDGIEHKLEPYSILVTDPLGNLSLGGVMGGADSEIKPETSSVFLEAAAWNFINIRRSSTRLGIHTDAAFRFSRGVHPSQALLGASRAADLLRRLAGGTVANGVIDNYPQPPEPVVITLKLDYAQRLSGLSLSGAEIADLLARLEFKSELHDDHLVVTVPDYRMDIEGPHDLVEEVCRLYGYDNIPSTVLADVLPPQRGNAKLEQEERIKDVLVQEGVQELITFRLTAPEHEAKLMPQGNKAGVDERPYVTLTNPLSAERAVMRHSLLTSVLEVAADNSRYQNRLALFEIGPIFLAEEDEVLPDEQTRLSLLMSGRRAPVGWQSSDPGIYDFFDLKGVLETLFGELHLTVRYEPIEHPTYRPGRTARLLLGGAQIGVMGELHPLVVEQFDLQTEEDQPVLAADIDLDALIDQIPSHYAYDPISPYPAVREDIAVVVDTGITAVTVEEIIRNSGGFLLKDVQLFDVYEGEQIGVGKKSLAYHLTFQAPNKTLTDKVVQKSRKKIVGQLKHRLNAQLRE